MDLVAESERSVADPGRVIGTNWITLLSPLTDPPFLNT